MYLVVQDFPEEKVIFASSLKEEAQKYFDLQVHHGKGWFELREEGRKIPLLAGGEELFSPYAPSRWDLMQLSAEMKNNNNTETEYPYFFPDNGHQYLQSVWE